MSAWLLWAQSAKACGSDPHGWTACCRRPRTNSSWSAGGLYPPQNLTPGNQHASPCIALVKLTTNGFVYDEKATNPTKGMEPFNCDADNVKKVKTYVTTS